MQEIPILLIECKNSINEFVQFCFCACHHRYRMLNSVVGDGFITASSLNRDD